MDASRSVPSRPGDHLGFTWLVQRAWPRYIAADALPPPILAGAGPAKRTAMLAEPGVYDVDVTVDDGVLGAIANRTIAVLPGGTRVGDAAADWEPASDRSGLRFADAPSGLEGTCVHVTSDVPRGFAIVAPRTRSLHLDAAKARRLGFFVRVQNHNEIGWRGSFPEVLVASADGSRRFRVKERTYPVDADGWMFVDLPLEGGEGWSREDQGELSTIDWVELRAESWGQRGFEIWLDALSFYAP
jgi:hypothetical protein